MPDQHGTGLPKIHLKDAYPFDVLIVGFLTAILHGDLIALKNCRANFVDRFGTSRASSVEVSGATTNIAQLVAIGIDLILKTETRFGATRATRLDCGNDMITFCKRKVFIIELED
jgi:hypothetical protein